MRKLLFALTCAALFLVAFAPTQAAAQSSCVSVNVQNGYQATVTNNCGQNVNVWIATTDDIQPGEGYGMSLNGGQSDEVSFPPTARGYKYFYCTNFETPIDTTTNSRPTYNSYSVQCRR